MTHEGRSLKPGALNFIAYVSHSNLLNSDEARAIAELAARKNRESDITGLLYCAGGTFLQFLEGEGQQLSKLLDKIEKDPRHNDVRYVCAKTIHQRFFPNWNMRYIESNELTLKNANCLLQWNLIDARQELSSSRLQELLAPFEGL